MQETVTVRPLPLASRRHQLVGRVRAAGLTLATVGTLAANRAFAQSSDIDAVIAPAEGAGDKVKTVVLALAVVVVTIAAIMWAARHVKPRG